MDENVFSRPRISSGQIGRDQDRILSEIAGTDGGIHPFTAAVRATRMPMIITDPRQHDNPIVFANDAFCRLTQYAREEILGRNCRFLQGPLTDRDDVSRIREAVDAKRSIEIDIRNYRKDGTWFWNSLLLAPVNDANGDLAYFFASPFDVTIERGRLASLADENARLLAEKAAAQARSRLDEESFRLAIGAAEIGTWDLDVEADVLTWSERTKRMFGMSPDATCSMADFYNGLHPEDLQRTSEAFASAMDPERRATYDVEYRTIGKEDGLVRWVAAKGKALFDDAGTCIRAIGTAIDISDRKETEARLLKSESDLREWAETLDARVTERTRELEEAQEVLRQAQKMEAVGQLTGGLAHDFNNLLAVISGSLDLLDHRLRQGRVNELDRYIMAAQGAAKRAASLTHRLLAFSRRQTLEPKPTSINQLVMGMDDLLRRTVGPQVAVEVIKAGELWNTLVDPHQLENALLNLCINARDAMPDGGRLTIETCNLRLDGRAARDADVAAGPYVSLSVGDTGAGMEPDVMSRAFEPFFTTKPTGQGTGLGLSMIYGFARQSGGQVRIASAVGKGTRVTIYLPRFVGDQPAGEDAVSVAAPRAHEGETVLVVDDEAAIRMLVADVLCDLGYTVLEACDGPSAMRILNADSTIHLLVTDVGLPNGMNGRQIADAARGARPTLKVLFMTGYAETAALDHGHLAPGMSIITKPFAMDALAIRIQEILTSDAPMG